MHKFLWIIFIFSLNGSTCFGLSLVHHQEQHLISCTAHLVHAGTSGCSQTYLVGLYTHFNMLHGTYNVKLNSSKREPIARSIFMLQFTAGYFTTTFCIFLFAKFIPPSKNFKIKFRKPYTNCNLSRKRMALLAGGNRCYRTMDGLTTKLFIRHKDRERARRKYELLKLNRFRRGRKLTTIYT